MRPSSPQHLQLIALASMTAALLLVLFAWPTSRPTAVAVDPHVASTPSSDEPPESHVESDPAESDDDRLRQGRWVEAGRAGAQKRHSATGAIVAPPLALADADPSLRVTEDQSRPLAEPSAGEPERNEQRGSRKLASEAVAALDALLHTAGDVNFGFVVRADDDRLVGVPSAEAGVAEELTVDFGAAASWATADARLRSGEALLAEIGFDLEPLGYTLSFEAPRASLLGLALVEERHIEIYVRPGMSRAAIVDVVGHEIGHAVDHVLVTTDDRARWRLARGIGENEPWWPTDLASDLVTPAGDFAECVGWLVTGSQSHSLWGSCDAHEAMLLEILARADESAAD